MAEQAKQQQQTATKPQTQAKQQPQQAAAKPAQAQGTSDSQALSPSMQASLLDRLNALENAVSEIQPQAVTAPAVVDAPTDLELSRSFAKDEDATSALVPSKARAIFQDKLDDFDPDTLLDYAVRGPYLIGALTDNGLKVAVEHGLNVRSQPSVGSKPRAQMSDEEYEQQQKKNAAAAKASASNKQ